MARGGSRAREAKTQCPRLLSSLYVSFVTIAAHLVRLRYKPMAPWLLVLQWVVAQHVTQQVDLR